MSTNFRILAINGGGSRGAFAVGFLSEIEKILGKPIINYFDLVAGTSSGSLTAILLALGYSTEDLENIYKNELWKMFVTYPKFFSGFRKPISWVLNPLFRYLTDFRFNFEESLHSKYINSAPYELFHKYVGEKKLYEITNARIVVPSTNILHEEATVFKTRHYPDQSYNYSVRAIDVILSSGAAPTYFDPVTIPNHGVFCDGGIWANNPSMVAYAEAIKISKVCNRKEDPKFTANDISIMSIGTGYNVDTFNPPEKKAGLFWWGKKLLELMFDSQAQSTCFYLERLLEEKFLHIDFQLPYRQWMHLDNLSYIHDLINLGRIQAQSKYKDLAPVFFQEEKLPFVPFS